MTSSAGWVRSNILYDTLKEVPPIGSPLETVCAYVFVHRQKAEYLKYRTLAQAQVNSGNKESVQESLDSLHAEMFPDVKTLNNSRSVKAKEIMERQLAKGPELVQTV